RYSFFTGPVPEQQILPGVEFMTNEFGPKTYIIAADYGFGQVSALWTEIAVAMNGGEIAGKEFIPLGNSQFSTTIANIQAADPDYVVAYMVGAAQSQFFPQAEAAGLNLPV